MATKISYEDIQTINELYLKIGTYSGVARELHIAPTTVKKYIIPNYKEHKTVEKKIFKKEDLPEFDSSLFKGITDYGYLCNLTKREEEEIKELWKEILL